MKRVFLLLLIGMLLACVPTPEEEIVTNKADGTLEDAIRHSEPIAPYAAEETATLRQTLGVPERWTDAYEGAIYGGTMHVSIDASVDVPDVSNVPVLAGTLDGARSEETERLTKLLLGDAPYFQFAFDWKAEKLSEIRFYQAWLDAIDAGLYSDPTEAREQCVDMLQAQQKEYQQAQEPSAPKTWNGSYADERFALMNAEGNGLQWYEYYFRYMERGSFFLTGFAMQYRPARSDAEQAAIDTAAAFLKRLDLCGVKPVGIYAFDEPIRNGLHTENGFDGAYIVGFAPIYRGIPVYGFTGKYYGSDAGALDAGYMEIEYAEAPEQETVNVTVRDGRVVSCMWMQPFHVTETVNESVQLLPFERIADIFRKNIFLSIFLDEKEDTLYLHVTDVKLSYMRVKQKDSERYYLLPVWDFLGYATSTEHGTLRAEEQTAFDSVTLLTVNAVDGTVIDRTFGY